MGYIFEMILCLQLKQEKKLKSFWSAFFFSIALFALSNAAFAQTYFNRYQEFPNYFVSEALRVKLKSNQNVPAEELKPYRLLLEQTLASVLNRMIIPIYDPVAKTYRNVTYFPYLNAKVKAENIEADLYPSGGVVRAALAYIYRMMNEAAETEGKFDSIEFLKKMRDQRRHINGLDIRGVGSDLDVLYVMNSNKIKDHDRLRELVKEITNSAALQATGASHVSATDGVSRTVFTESDIKDYRAHTLRSTVAGGSELDFLAFDLRRKKFIEPEGHEGIVDQFLRGYYEYSAPKAGHAAEDPAKQTIRGLRPLIELPFLDVRDPKILKEELATLIKDVKTKKPISQKALDQIPKIVRNQQSEGGHNRFYRSRVGTVDRLAFQLSEALKSTLGSHYIPEFTDRTSLDKRRVTREAHSIDSLLMKPEVFYAEHTSQGRLYHGTRDINGALSILRGGLFISSKNQGRAVYGRGTYTSPDLKFAEAYTEGTGVVFTLNVKKHTGLRVLDWEKHEDDPRIKQIVNQANIDGKDPFEVLARVYQIDIIVNEHILIQNAGAISLSQGYQSIIEGFVESLQKGGCKQNIVKCIEMSDVLTELSGFVTLFGIKKLSVTRYNNDLLRLAREILNGGVRTQNFKEVREAVSALILLKVPVNKMPLGQIISLLRAADTYSEKAAALEIYDMLITNSHLKVSLQNLKELLDLVAEVQTGPALAFMDLILDAQDELGVEGQKILYDFIRQRDIDTVLEQLMTYANRRPIVRDNVMEIFKTRAADVGIVMILGSMLSTIEPRPYHELALEIFFRMASNLTEPLVFPTTHFYIDDSDFSSQLRYFLNHFKFASVRNKKVVDSIISPIMGQYRNRPTKQRPRHQMVIFQFLKSTKNQDAYYALSDYLTVEQRNELSRELGLAAELSGDFGQAAQLAGDSTTKPGMCSNAF